MNYNSPTAIPKRQLVQPRTTNGGFTTDYITMKHALSVRLSVDLTQAVGHATLLTPTQATSVAGAGAKALTFAVQIWANEDTAATDTEVLQTAAKNYTVAADIKNKIVEFVIRGDCLDVEGGFDCISLVCADSSQATNFAAVSAFVDTQFKQTTPPSDIVD